MARTRVLALVAALALSGCGGGDDPSAETETPRWRVKDGFVRAPDGRRAILRGANLAGSHKFSPYFGFHQPADYAALREHWGMTSIRFLILWAALEPEKGSYDEAYLDGIEERMGWARDAGLTVVLDMHQDVYGEGFTGGDGAARWTCDEANYKAFTPTSPWFLNYLDPAVQACVDGFYGSDELQDHYIEAWRRVAGRLGKHDAVVGFDVMNEPHWGSGAMTGYEELELQPFYERLVPRVREVAPSWLAFLEPGASRNLGTPTGLTPMPFLDVVYAPHSYNASAEQGQGFDPKVRGALISNIETLATEARALDAALWVGEYGGTSTSPGITEYMDASYDGFASVAASSMYWAYDANSGGYGMLNDDRTPKPVMEEILIRPAPELVAGDPVSWTFDEKTRNFALTWHPDPAVMAPTVLSVPARVYPNGYSVSCDGCESEQATGRLTISVPPKGDPALVELVAKP